MRLTENTGRKKVAKNRHLGTIAQLCRATSSQLRHVSTIGKKLLSSNMSSTCPHNMVNFGPLAAEIGLPVWGIPANFNGFRVFAALLHGSQIVSVSQICGIEQRAPPMFGRATIRLGIGPHSSFFIFYSFVDLLLVFYVLMDRNVMIQYTAIHKYTVCQKTSHLYNPQPHIAGIQ